MRDYAGPQVAIGNGQTINATVKPYLDALTAAVLADPAVIAAGLTSLVYTEGTRTWARQNYLFVNQDRPGFNAAYSPDRPSDHQWGNAIDFGSGAGYAGTPVQLALHRLGPRYGFSFPISNELWHGVCDPATAQPLPSQTPLKEDEHMSSILYLKVPSGERGIVGDGYQQAFKDESERELTLAPLYRAAKLGAVKITELTVSLAEFKRLMWATTPDDIDTIKNR